MVSHLSSWKAQVAINRHEDCGRSRVKAEIRNLALDMLNFRCISSVQSLSHVRLFVTPRTAARQASLSITNSWSLLKHTSIESVMPSSHLIPLSSPSPSLFPSTRVLSKQSVLRIRWPKYWSYSFSISPSNEYSRLFP